MDLNMLQKKADEYNQAIAAASDWCNNNTNNNPPLKR
jgi:hypothetical protein